MDEAINDDSTIGERVIPMIECRLSCKGNGGREVPVLITGLQGSVTPEQAEDFIKKVAVVRDFPALQMFLQGRPSFAFTDGGILNASRVQIKRSD